MLFNAQHDILEVQWCDITGPAWILQLKCLQCTFFVEVMKKLRKFRVVNGARSVTSEVKLCEGSIELEGDF